MQHRAGVVVLAATNRPDRLDPALLRPGRFDRLLYVPVPDCAAREAILQVHTRRTPLSPDVDLPSLARQTDRCACQDHDVQSNRVSGEHLPAAYGQ